VKKITLDRVGEIVWRYHVPVGSGCDNLKIMFVGCSHLDSIECNRAKLKSVLNRAVDEGARIIFNGDNFDLMQGRNDPRRTKTAMKPEYVGSYVNDIVSDAVDFFSKYAANIDIMALGNHETSFMRNCDVDVNKFVCDMMSTEDHRVYTGSIMGYLQLVFCDSNRHSGTRLVHFRHDGGALGKRSKGILAYDILAGEHSNTDVFVTAHGHQMIHHETKSEVVDKGGNVKYRERILLSCPSFKEEWADKNKSNWWCATNKGPRAVGGWLTTFRALRAERASSELEISCIPEFVK